MSARVFPAPERGAATLSVIVPVYQEREGIGAVLRSLDEVLNGCGMPYEMIAVDDGSSDGTAEILADLRNRELTHLRVIRHPYNKGQGSAIKSGIRAAGGDWIALLDGDGQHDPCELPRLLEHMNLYDMVVGARGPDYRGARHRDMANRFYNALASWASGFKIDDLTSGYRVFRGPVIRRYVHLLPARFSSPTTSTMAFIKGGYSVRYVPVHVRSRLGGSSKIRVFRDGWRFLVIIFKILVVFEPLRLFVPVCLLSAALALLSTAYSTWSLHRPHVPNSAVFLLIFSVLALLLGLISEQIALLQLSLARDSQPAEHED